MPKEIERRFLVPMDVWNEVAPSLNIKVTDNISQIYLIAPKGTVSRVRIYTEQKKAIHTVKSNFDGISCTEVESEMDYQEAMEIFTEELEHNPKAIITKVRNVIPFGDLKIEVDVFRHPLNLQGLIIAEVELPSEDHSIEIPEWFGKEVSGLREWSNNSLVQFGRPDNV